MALFGFGSRVSGAGSGQASSSPDGPVRMAAVAGSFYPSDKGALENELARCFSEAAGLSGGTSLSAGGTPYALIVPHAGYVYSGAVAASAFLQIPPDARFDRIILIGPSHRIAFEGAVVDTGNGFWQTPLGNIPVDLAFGKRLRESAAGKVFKSRQDAFLGEHCLEVELPFLQYRLRHMPPIVPVILGSVRYSVIKDVAEALRPAFLEGRSLFVISSDFSHYPSYDGAVKADTRTAEAVATGDLVEFADALRKNNADKIPGLETSACGQAAIAVLLEATGSSPYPEEFEYHHLAYQNSGDVKYGDKSHVVGYHAFAVRRLPAAGRADGGDYTLSAEEKNTLLSIARASIEGSFEGKGVGEVLAPFKAGLTPKLKAKGGAFVTLTKRGRLRGCIGHFGEDFPVYETVAHMARSAAFNDSRFAPLASVEVPQVEIEISVLSPLKRIGSAGELKLGRDGIYMVKGGKSGTFLPQVAMETGWSKEEFLGHCARDKAGIGWDGWKTAELYTYQAVVFKEN